MVSYTHTTCSVATTRFSHLTQTPLAMWHIVQEDLSTVRHFFGWVEDVGYCLGKVKLQMIGFGIVFPLELRSDPVLLIL